MAWWELSPATQGCLQRITNIRKDKAIVSSILIKERLRFMLSQIMAITELKNPGPN